ncbi:MAG: thermonuclease family protein [Ghiorsea sp.]|nr:thermonuclease family protein [Ghiorsea sp.]
MSVQPVVAGTLSWVTQERWVSVKSITDGDTFKTTKGEKIRLLGINTPETRKDTSPAQPFANQAKQALKKMIDGKQVRLSFDKEKKDRYGRTLAHIYTRDGLWVNAELVRLGLAHVYTFAPNTKLANRLTSIEQQAIRQNTGMWSHQRWRVLQVSNLSTNILGQFRLVQGEVTKLDKRGWGFNLGKLTVTIPKKHRASFGKKLRLKIGDTVLVRGKVRLSKRGKWFLSIYNRSDVHHIK